MFTGIFCLDCDLLWGGLECGDPAPLFFGVTWHAVHHARPAAAGSRV
jgi:hypothetical protein